MESKAILFFVLVATCVAIVAVLTLQVPELIAYPAFCVCAGWTLADLINQLIAEREENK